jgi:Kef-type K+ transport system membrane component KefB
MNKKIKFTLITVWVVFSRSYDAYCTNIYTPDLSKEANPLVSILGVSSWTTLLIILCVLTIYVIYSYYISLFYPMNLFPEEKGYTFNNFIAFLYLGYKDKWTAMLYKLPNNIKRVNHYLGQLLTKSLVYAGVVSTTMWLLINYSSSYRKVHNAFVVYFILITGCLLISYYWNKKLFKQYQNDVNKISG